MQTQQRNQLWGSCVAALLCTTASASPIATTFNNNSNGAGSESGYEGLSPNFNMSWGSAAQASADHSDHAGHHHHRYAPIGVMGDHVHAQGEWMFSVRAMRMHMDGMRNNQESLSSSEVLASGFMVTPTEMDMDMLMFGAMYAATDELTLMAMIPYVSNEMDHVTGMGARFTTESDGLGDIRLGGLYKFFESGTNSMHWNIGLSIPTGSIDERDDTPAMNDAKLPYPMQLGTGTFDFLPGFTYLGEKGDWSYGAQAIARFHLGTNDEDYRHGNRLDSTVWLSHGLSAALSSSLRLNFAHWENFHGADPDLNPNMVPTANPNLRGGDRVDLLWGLRHDFSGDPHTAGNQIALEVGSPIYQDLDGPALETDWIATVGWQYSF